MNVEFSKMHGAGNDFIIIDMSTLPEGNLPTEKGIINLCNRKRGIGADGLIVLQKEQSDGADFRMIFYNNDGQRETMFGNGLRCASLYANRYFYDRKSLSAMTDSGLLQTEIISDNTVKIEIPCLQEFKPICADAINLYFGNTGVPHAVLFVENNENIDVVKEGRYLRNHKAFSPKGTNVNFVSQIKGSDSIFIIRTYERGVEDETLACGTGISASAICASLFRKAGKRIIFRTKSADELTVEIPEENDLRKVFLTGPAVEVYKGLTCCQF